MNGHVQENGSKTAELINSLPEKQKDVKANFYHI